MCNMPNQNRDRLTPDFFAFTFPIFIGNIFQQLYNIVDTIIVGQFVGTGALAAVGSTGTVSFMLLGFLMGFTTGVTVPTGQHFGAGDMQGMRKTVASAILLCCIGSVLMTVLGMTIMGRLLRIMQTPQDIFSGAYSYIMIICGGIVAQIAYNLLSCLLRALGNSRVPLYFLILAALLNIVLDLVFIVCFHMGTAMSAYCAQNTGAGEVGRVRSEFRAATVIAAVYSAFVGVPLFFFGKYMTYIFVSGDGDMIIEEVNIFLRCTAVFFIPLAIVNIYRNAIQGMGYGLMPMMAGVAELAGRTTVALIAAQYASYMGVCMASPVAWTMASALLVTVYFHVIRQQETNCGLGKEPIRRKRRAQA